MSTITDNSDVIIDSQIAKALTHERPFVSLAACQFTSLSGFMWNSTELLKIISGRRNDLVAIAVRFALGLLTPFYRAAVWWRNRRFDSHPETIRRVAVPVISIGNLTTGGTGKTPMVHHIAHWFRQRHIRVAIVAKDV